MDPFMGEHSYIHSGGSDLSRQGPYEGMEPPDLDRRDFLKLTGAGALGFAASQLLPDDPEQQISLDIPAIEDSLQNIELFDPADGYDALVELLDRYGTDPVRVIVGPGTIDCRDNLVVPSNTWLQGVGRQTVFRLPDGTDLSNAGIIRVGRKGHDVRFSDFVIDGNRENNIDHGGEYGFYVSQATDIICENIRAVNCPGYGFDPHAKDRTHQSERVRIVNCHAENNGLDGITLAGCQDSSVINCVSIDNDRHGINLTDPPNADITVVGNTTSGNSVVGVFVMNGGGDLTITGNTISGNRHGVKIANSDDLSHHVVFANNIVRDNTGSGIRFHKIRYAAISNNMFRDNAEDMQESVLFGSHVGSEQTGDILFSGNLIDPRDTEYGIRVSADHTGLKIIDNMVRNVEDVIEVEAGEVEHHGNHTRRNTVEIEPAETSHVIGADIGTVTVEPRSSLGDAGHWWLEEAADGTRLRLDTAPGQSVRFHVTIDI